MLDLDTLLLVATMVRLAQTWALLPLPVECLWTDDGRGALFRSRYWTFVQNTEFDNVIYALELGARKVHRFGR